jgi:hypothetical protein
MITCLEVLQFGSELTTSVTRDPELKVLNHGTRSLSEACSVPDQGKSSILAWLQISTAQISVLRVN